MTNLLSYLSTAAGALCLILGIWLLSISNTNRSLRGSLQDLQKRTLRHQKALQVQQRELQTQQEQINAGQTINQQVGPAVLQEMAAVSTKDEKMKELLLRHGYSVDSEAGE